MIYGSRLKQARELRGLTQAELAKKVGRDQSLIAYIESGFKDPSADVLDALATETNLPVTFFSTPLENALPGGSLLFRAHASLTKREMQEALRQAEIVFDLGMHLSGQVKEQTANIQPRYEQVDEAARRVRESLGIASDIPVASLIRKLERAGVWVLPISNLQGRDAFSIWVPISGREIPVMAISTGRPGDRVRFSVAHELGHLVLHKQLPFKTPREIEEEANEFAAEFLMPARAMRNELKSPVTLTSVARLKPHWGVAMQALIRRAKDIDAISERQYRYLFQQISARGWRMAEPENLNIPAEKPRLIAKMAEVVYGVPIPHAKLAAAIHISVSEMRSIIDLFAQQEDFGSDMPTRGKVVRFPKKNSIH